MDLLNKSEIVTQVTKHDIGVISITYVIVIVTQLYNTKKFIESLRINNIIAII